MLSVNVIRVAAADAADVAGAASPCEPFAGVLLRPPRLGRALVVCGAGGRFLRTSPVYALRATTDSGAVEVETLRSVYRITPREPGSTTAY